MSSEDFDIDSLLADILDDDKPLPTAVKQPKPVPTPKPAAKPSDDDLLDALFGDEPATPTPMQVAEATEINTEMALADAGMNEPEPEPEPAPAPKPQVTQRVTNEEREAALDIQGRAWARVGLETSGLTPDEEIDQLLGLAPVDPQFDTLDKPDPAPMKGVAKVLHKAIDSIFADSEEREEGAQVQPLKMPEFTAADFASTMDIRNFATLVTLNTARWHAKVKDRQAGKDAATMNDADAGAFEVRKRLLSGADSMLKTIHKAIDEARAAHYEMTLPWTTTSMQDIGRRTGGRLLPNTLFVEYTTVMAQKKQQMQDALAKFIPEYPKLVEAARKNLGKRFDAREYPNPSSIASHFDLSFDFQPIPKGDDFKGLPQVQLDALARKINDNTQKQAENAMQEVWMRLYDVVAKMAERLSSPDKLFHNTLVQNVRDTARLLAHLNVTHDAKVEALRKKVEKHLCQHEPKELRENQTIRMQVAAHAQSIIDEMNK
jgi:hypothetical protein